MKDSEKRFLMIVYTKVNASNGVYAKHVLDIEGNAKQNLYYLEKWTKKDWYDYGVSINTGWLTGLGKQKAWELLPWWNEAQQKEAKEQEP